MHTLIKWIVDTLGREVKILISLDISERAIPLYSFGNTG